MTPAADHRTATDIGRHARLELVFARRSDRTVLAHAYAEPPLRAPRPFADADLLRMILASSAPGVFGGDRFQYTIRVERGARVRLASQSALQVHPASDGAAARIDAEYVVESGATLICEWEPAIPFASARLDQSVRVALARGASLFWSDALMCGRQAAGERWQFASLGHELRVSMDGALAYLERFHLVPGERHLERRWLAGEATYSGTALACGPEFEGVDVERLHRELGLVPGVLAAADRARKDLLVVRMLGEDGAAFREARGRIAAAVQASAARA